MVKDTNNITIKRYSGLTDDIGENVEPETYLVSLDIISTGYKPFGNREIPT
jgi:hypothetical protein